MDVRRGTIGMVDQSPGETPGDCGRDARACHSERRSVRGIWAAVGSTARIPHRLRGSE